MTSCRPSRRASLPSLGGTSDRARFFAPADSDACSAGPGLLAVRPTRDAASVAMETPGTPMFLGNPLFPFAHVLRPRQDRAHQASKVCRHGPRYVHGEGSHKAAFEAQSHGFGTGCLRFAGRVTPTPRKTRFRLLAKLFRTGLVTRRVPSKGFKLYPTSILLSDSATPFL